MTMRRGSRRGSRGGRAPRRKTTWEQLVLGSAGGGPATSFADISAPYLITIPSRQATILRLVGNISCTASAGNVFEFGVGISVVNQEVVDGGTDLPLPLTDTNQSWYYWEAQIGRINGGVTQVFEDFDIRTSRHIRSGFALALVFQKGATHGGNMAINFQARALWSPG